MGFQDVSPAFPANSNDSSGPAASPESGSDRRTAEHPEAERDSTRCRLLLAAGEAFAEHGFHNATVGMICKAAGANIAAVNYYFGSKEKLYEEAIKFGRSSCPHSRLLESDELSAMEPRAALRAFIDAYIRTLLRKDEHQWHSKIICRELAEPTPALDTFIREVVRLRRKRLGDIIHRLVGSPLPARQTDLVIESIIAQGQFYYRCRPILLRMRGKGHFDEQEMTEIVDHITAFSLGGIGTIAAQRPGGTHPADGGGAEADPPARPAASRVGSPRTRK